MILLQMILLSIFPIDLRESPLPYIVVTVGAPWRR